jgi:hypothetical protein
MNHIARNCQTLRPVIDATALLVIDISEDQSPGANFILPPTSSICSFATGLVAVPIHNLPKVLFQTKLGLAPNDHALLNCT